ncbi:hypothetical protein ACJX0J_005456, partial [Zea mays]
QQHHVLVVVGGWDVFHVHVVYLPFIYHSSGSFLFFSFFGWKNVVVHHSSIIPPFSFNSKQPYQLKEKKKKVNICNIMCATLFLLESKFCFASLC